MKPSPANTERCAEVQHPSTKLRPVAVSLSLVLVLAGCSGGSGSPTTTTPSASTSAAPSGTPFKVGFVGGISGVTALNAQSALDGLTIAVDKVNKAGGIMGRPIEIVTADDQGTPAGGVNAVTKLVSQDKVDAVFGPDLSSITLAVEEIPSKAGKLQFTSSISPQITESGVSNWIFRLRPNSNTGAKLTVDYVVNTLGFKRVGIMYSREGFGQAGLAGITAELKALGLDPVAVESGNITDTDFTSQILNLKKANPDVVLAWVNTEVADAILTKQRIQLGLPGPIVGTNAMLSAVGLKLLGPAADGVIAAEDWDPSDSSPLSTAFVTDFKSAHPNDVITFHAPLYYDGILMLAKAAELGGGTSEEQLRSGMHDLHCYKGVMGNYNYDTKGDPGSFGSLYQYHGTPGQGGAVQLLKRVDNSACQ
jgi:branched-chain amino acid transport system substrate-binding protein